MNNLHRFVLGFVATGMTGAPAFADYVQPDDRFRAALLNDSTSPSFILITVRNARDGSIRTGCMPAPFLLGAIHREYSLPYDKVGVQRAIDIATAAKGHSFTFRDPAAIANISFGDDPRTREACDLIRSGRQAFMTDRSGQIREGIPDFH